MLCNHDPIDQHPGFIFFDELDGGFGKPEIGYFDAVDFGGEVANQCEIQEQVFLAVEGPSAVEVSHLAGGPVDEQFIDLEMETIGGPLL